MKEVLVVIDMQNDFVFGSLGSQEARDILPALRERVEAARKNGTEIVFTRDTHEKNYLQTQEGKRLPVEHCIRNTDGWQIVEGLYKNGEKIFDKPTFGSVQLAKYLAEEPFDTVTFCGVCTDICVISNALLCKAFAPEKTVRAIEECMAGVSVESHRAAIAAMRSCQVEIL